MSRDRPDGTGRPRPPDSPGATWRSQILEVHTPPESVPAIYSRIAPLYELWARLAESKARRAVLARSRVRDGEAVLEVATGTGVQLVALARANPSGQVVGVELADGMLAQTRRRLRSGGLSGRVALERADARILPFADTSFDLVVCCYLLDLLPRDDIPVVLSELKRVLRPGGRLVLADMTIAERATHRLWDALYQRGIVLTANCRGVLAAPVLEELGYHSVEREYLSQMLFPTEVVVARR